MAPPDLPKGRSKPSGWPPSLFLPISPLSGELEGYWNWRGLRWGFWELLLWIYWDAPLFQLVARRFGIDLASLRRFDGEGSPCQCRALSISVKSNKRFSTIMGMVQYIHREAPVNSKSFLLLFSNAIIQAKNENLSWAHAFLVLDLTTKKFYKWK